jgi:hypothetical protein
MVVKPPDGSAAPDPAAVAEAHRQLLADPSIQFDLPQPEPATTAVREPPIDFGDAPSFSLPGEFGALFYVLLGLLVLLALFFLARFVMERQWRRGNEADEAMDWRPEAQVAQGLLGEADALAARGLFSEAAHLLLFRSIEDIDSRRPALIRPAFTSRDIAGLDPIPPRPRSAFVRIAMSVERSLFAQRPLAETDWRDCRAAYEEFAFAEGWQG